jgi:hypothetical protein
LGFAAQMATVYTYLVIGICFSIPESQGHNVAAVERPHQGADDTRAASGKSCCWSGRSVPSMLLPRASSRRAMDSTASYNRLVYSSQR